MIYLISYDLNRPGQNYKDLHDAIKELGAWWHYLDSTWLIDTRLGASEIYRRLSPHMDKNDRVLIISVGSDYNGWLTQDAWDWINERLRTAA